MNPEKPASNPRERLRFSCIEHGCVLKWSRQERAWVCDEEHETRVAYDKKAGTMVQLREMNAGTWAHPIAEG